MGTKITVSFTTNATTVDNAAGFVRQYAPEMERYARNNGVEATGWTFVSAEVPPRAVQVTVADLIAKGVDPTLAASIVG